MCPCGSGRAPQLTHLSQSLSDPGEQLRSLKEIPSCAQTPLLPPASPGTFLLPFTVLITGDLLLSFRAQHWRGGDARFKLAGEGNTESFRLDYLYDHRVPPLLKDPKELQKCAVRFALGLLQLIIPPSLSCPH